MIKEKYLGTYMKTAKLFAEHSSAVRKKVGAVIVCPLVGITLVKMKLVV